MKISTLLKNWFIATKYGQNVISNALKRSKLINRLLLLTTSSQLISIFISSLLSYILGFIIIFLMVYQYNIPATVLQTWGKQLTKEESWILRLLTSISVVIPYIAFLLFMEIPNILPKIINVEINYNIINPGSELFFNYMIFVGLIIGSILLIFIMYIVYSHIGYLVANKIGRQARINLQITLISIVILAIITAIGGDFFIAIATSIVALNMIRKYYSTSKGWKKFKIFQQKRDAIEYSFWKKWNEKIFSTKISYILFGILITNLFWIMINYRFGNIIFKSTLLDNYTFLYGIILPFTLAIISTFLSFYFLITDKIYHKKNLIPLGFFILAIIIFIIYPKMTPIYYYTNLILKFDINFSIIISLITNSFFILVIFFFSFTDFTRDEIKEPSYELIRRFEYKMSMLLCGFFGFLINLIFIMDNLLFKSENNFFTDHFITTITPVITLLILFIFILEIIFVIQNGIEWQMGKGKDIDRKSAEKYFIKYLKKVKNYEITKKYTYTHVKNVLIIYFISLVSYFILIYYFSYTNNLIYEIFSSPLTITFIPLLLFIIPKTEILRSFSDSFKIRE